MVTKRQQLKWLAKRFESLPFDGDSILMSDEVLGYLGHEYKITNQELKQERDKMQKKAEQAEQAAQHENSWHDRGEFPPVGCECEVKDGGEWRKTHIVGFDDDGYCVHTTPWNSLARDYDGDMNQYNFRPLSPLSPLRTEREKAIDEMVSVILDYDGYMITSATAELVARQLHYAGYHK